MSAGNVLLSIRLVRLGYIEVRESRVERFDLPWKKWSTLIERIRLIQTLIEGGKNEPQKDPGTDYQQAA